jgi:hypothetical protein
MDSLKTIRDQARDRPFVQMMERKGTSFGPALYIRIRTENYRELGWEELYDTFSRAFPGQWAVQFFPPRSELVNDVNCYHLYVLDESPDGVNIRRRWDD